MDTERLNRLLVAREHKCATCFFFEAFPSSSSSSKQSTGKGTCRRFPAAPFGRDGDCGQPITYRTDWCGEWELHIEPYTEGE